MSNQNARLSTFQKRFVPLKEYPGYVITRTGKVYRGTGFPVGERMYEEEGEDGLRYVTIHNAKGRLRRVCVSDLQKDTFPDLYKVVQPNQELDGDEYVLLRDYPAFEINRRGEVRRVDTGAYLALFYRAGKRTPVYHLYNRTAYVNRLLYMAFGDGAAEAAGYKATKEELKARRIKELAELKRRIQERQQAGKVRGPRVHVICERCGRECEGRLCDECWKKERGYM